MQIPAISRERVFLFCQYFRCWLKTRWLSLENINIYCFWVTYFASHRFFNLVLLPQQNPVCISFDPNLLMAILQQQWFVLLVSNHWWIIMCMACVPFLFLCCGLHTAAFSSCWCTFSSRHRYRLPHGHFKVKRSTETKTYSLMSPQSPCHLRSWRWYLTCLSPESSLEGIMSLSGLLLMYQFQ